MSESETEHFTISHSGNESFKELLHLLIDAGLGFKSGAPFQVSAKFDREVISKISAVSDQGEPLARVLNQFLTEVLPRSLNFGSPHFLAHPDCGNSMAAVMGDVATAFLQQNLVTHEYSSIATQIEFEILHQLRKLVGYGSQADFSSGITDAGGVFLFGGSGGNLSGLMAAREHLSQRLRRQGKVLDRRKARVLANSPYTHYSLRRSLFILGLGNRDITAEECAARGLSPESLLPVATKGFRMDPSDLERKIEETLECGEEIVSIFAVSGDSRIMEFDDLEAITAVAAKYGIWVHVDAAQGGQCLFSPRRRHLLKGVERVDSISLDPHKVLMLPYNLGVLLLKDPAHMELISSGASVIRLGKGSFGTYTPAVGSRGFNSLKLWFLLKHWGWDRVAEEIDRRHELAQSAYRLLAEFEDLTPIHPEPMHNSIGFVFNPKSANLKVADINRINAEIHREICGSGDFFIHMMAAHDAYKVVTDTSEEIFHLRMMFGNPSTNLQIVKECLEEIVRAGRDLVPGVTNAQSELWSDHDH